MYASSKLELELDHVSDVGHAAEALSEEDESVKVTTCEPVRVGAETDPTSVGLSFIDELIEP